MFCERSSCMTPKVAANGSDAAGAIIQVTMPRLVDAECGVQLDSVLSRNQRSDLISASAIGDP